MNPRLDLSAEIQDGLEGCLSIPDLSFECRRARAVVATQAVHGHEGGGGSGIAQTSSTSTTGLPL